MPRDVETPRLEANDSLCFSVPQLPQDNTEMTPAATAGYAQAEEAQMREPGISTSY